MRARLAAGLLVTHLLACTNNQANVGPRAGSASGSGGAGVGGAGPTSGNGHGGSAGSGSAGTAGAASAGGGGQNGVRDAGPDGPGAVDARVSGTGGISATGGSGGSAGTGAAGAAGGGGVAGTDGCSLPAPVSFQRNVQPFLIRSCGSNGSDGCHVIDTASTVAQGGRDHAYDWITAGAHASSCPESPTPLRFQVVLAVTEAANPAVCSKSRQMPPPNETGAALRAPLTKCEVAALSAWLQEPYVTQTHRADDSSPTGPYPMPPFN